MQKSCLPYLAAILLLAACSNNSESKTGTVAVKKMGFLNGLRQFVRSQRLYGTQIAERIMDGQNHDIKEGGNHERHENARKKRQVVEMSSHSSRHRTQFRAFSCLPWLSSSFYR